MLARLAMWLCTAVVLVPAGAVSTAHSPGTAHSKGTAHPAAAYLARQYTATSDAIANPGRGFYRYSETHFTADHTGYRPLDATALTQDRLANGITLVFRYFYLDAYVGQDTIAASDLDLIRADFAAARAAGVKLVARFAYTATSAADAPLARVLTHISQLGPVLTANADVIAALQAGFIGQWGEWYYTDNFASDPSTPWLLTDADWAARRSVLLALLSATSPSTPVQVRYPAIKQKIFPDGTDARAARVGIHDDCFLAGTDDYGTLPAASDPAWLTQQTASVIMGGETCAANSPRSDWATAATSMAAYHWTFLNADYNTDVLSSWGTAGRAEATNRLGYRLRLVQANLPAGASPGATVQATITLTNDGYAAPIATRPVQLVLRDGTGYRTVAFATDTRTWAPGTTITLTASFPAPTRTGTYPLYLNLPDPVPGLATQQPLAAGGGTVNGAYAIHLANPAVWDAQDGWNDLGQSLTVA